MEPAVGRGRTEGNHSHRPEAERRRRKQTKQMERRWDEKSGSNHGGKRRSNCCPTSESESEPKTTRAGNPLPGEKQSQRKPSDLCEYRKRGKDMGATASCIKQAKGKRRSNCPTNDIESEITRASNPLPREKQAQRKPSDLYKFRERGKDMGATANCTKQAKTTVIQPPASDPPPSHTDGGEQATTSPSNLTENRKRGWKEGAENTRPPDDLPPSRERRRSARVGRWSIGDPPPATEPKSPNARALLGENHTKPELEDYPAKARRKRLLEKRLERNNSRIDALDAADLKTIGEFDTTQRNGEEGTFLDDRASAFFPKPASAPDDAFPPPPWFMKAVVDVAQSIQEAPLAPPFEFQPTEAAALANAETLAKAGYDLGKIIKEHSSSTLGYGSEFRPICQLKSVIGLHPNFMALADMIENGMSYIFHRAISEDEQQAETTAMIARGNHKSAQTETDVVAKLLSKDVIHGFSIPLPVSAIPLIPHAGVQPLGLVSQWTIDENGNRIKKFRITQDLTFSSEKGLAAKSINSRINMTAYAEMVYGWCFPRILHFISALRAKYPGIVIFIAKYD